MITINEMQEKNLMEDFLGMIFYSGKKVHHIEFLLPSGNFFYKSVKR